MRILTASRYGLVPALAVLLVAGCAAPPADPVESGTFLVRLGTDTIAVERWTRTPDGLEAVTAYRTPRTTRRAYAVLQDEDGRIASFRAGLAANELEDRDVDPVGAVPVAGGFYAPFALAVASAIQAADETTDVAYLVGNNVRPVTIARADDDAFELENQFGAPMTVRTDARGRITRMEVEGGWTIERVDGLDFDALAAEFEARDERGEGLGPLSPRDTVRARVGGADVAVEYGRPAARGRTVFGGLVPYGEIWRTGADLATHLRVDRPIEIGGIHLEPGAYSLFTVPDRDGWELIVNRATGMSGLARNPDQDVGRIPMRVTELPELVDRFTILVDEVDGRGVLRMQWERVEAAVDFVVH